MAALFITLACLILNILGWTIVMIHMIVRWKEQNSDGIGEFFGSVLWPIGALFLIAEYYATKKIRRNTEIRARNKYLERIIKDQGWSDPLETPIQYR